MIYAPSWRRLKMELTPMTKDERISQPNRENRSNQRRCQLNAFVQRGFTNPHKRFILSLSCKSMTGIGLSESTAQAAYQAVFLCVKSHVLIMSDWEGSRKTGRFVDPVDQPTQSGAMIGLMLSGLKTYQRLLS
jgi:hypothetical protein